MNPLLPIDGLTGAYPNIVPMTLRENATVAYTIAEMRKWINESLVPFVNDNINSLGEGWVAEVTRLIENWETLSVALTAQVQEIADGVTGSTIEAKNAQAAAEAARDLAEIFASQAAEVQDSALTLILNDFDSQFRKGVESLLSGLITEDSEDPGTFIIFLPDAPPPPAPVVAQPDPTDPGFFG